MKGNSKLINKLLMCIMTVCLIAAGTLCISFSSEAKKGNKGWTSDGKFQYRVIAEPSGKNPGKAAIINMDKKKTGTEVVVPDIILCKNKKNYTVTEIDCRGYEDENIISRCKWIKSVTIPKTCEKIGSSSFEESSLEKVIFEKNSNLKEIESYAFCCTNLKEIIIPENCKYIGAYAFSGDDNEDNYYAISYDKIVFEKGSQLKTIGEWAFSYTNLKEIVIPKNCTNISSSAFDKATIGKLSLEAGSKLKQFTVPKGCLAIADNGFKGTDITKITFEKDAKLKTIGNSAFENTKLTEISIPKTVEKIGDSVFLDSNLQEITFSDNSSLKSIGAKAFANVKLNEIEIPRNCTDVNSNAFFGATIGKLSLEAGSKLKQFTVPKGCLAIADNGFSGTAITKITFEKGSNLKTIGDSAFSDTKITEISIPKSVTKIGDRVFYGSSLKKIAFDPASKLQKIGYQCFRETPIKEITIPATVNEIGKDAFCYSNIQKCTFKKGSKLKTIKWGTFACTFKLESIEIPASCTQIGEIAFAGSGIKKVTFESGSKLKEIGDSAFGISYYDGTDRKIGYDTPNLKEIIIPKSCERIEESAFQGSGLQKITFEKGSKLSYIGAAAFDGCNLGKVYLPNNTITFGGKNQKPCESFGDGNKTIYTANKKVYTQLSDKIKWVDKKQYIQYGYNLIYTGTYTITYMVSKTPESEQYDKTVLKDQKYGAKVALKPPYNKDAYKGYQIVLTYRNPETYEEQTYTWGQGVDLSGKGNVVVYLDTIPAEYMVEYSDNGIEGYAGYGGNQFKVAYNEIFYLNRDYSRNEKYDFVCWNTKQDGTGISYKAGQKVSKLTTKNKITLYAIWKIRKNKIRFFADGGKGEMEDLEFADGSVILPESKFEYKDKHFLCWEWRTHYLNDKGEEKVYKRGTYKPGETFYVNQDTGSTFDLYAIWSNKSYNLHIDPNGGTGTAKTVEINDTSDLNVRELFTTDFTKENSEIIGYRFGEKDNLFYLTELKNWSSKDLYDYIAETFPDETDITIHAVWKKQTYLVTFDEVGGDGFMDGVVYECGEKVRLPKCAYTKDGYVFAGWAVEEAPDTVKYANEEEICQDTEDSLNLYAVWEKQDYLIVYHANGGTGSMRKDAVSYDEAFTLSPVMFRRSGYTFIGWTTRKDGGSFYQDQATVKNLSKDGSNVDLYARWEEKRVTIYFSANGGEVNRTSKSVKYDEVCGTLPTPIRKGYVFKGWFTSKSGNVQYTSQTKVIVNQDITLYARWEPKKITIYLNPAGGELKQGTTSIVVEADKGITGLPSANRKNYTFDGWWTEYTGGQRVVAGSTFTENTQLYAHWISKSTGRVNVRLTIKKYEGAEGCVIYYSKYSDFSKAKSVRIKSSKTSLSTLIGGLENGTTYYFRARQYKVKNGKNKYGKYGSTVSRKVP